MRLSVNTTPGEKPAAGGPGDLDRVVALARRLAAQREAPVGRRELLLALAATEPRLVTNAALRQGVDPRRLAWAVSEWWPGGELPAPRVEPPLTAPARTALAGARAAAAGGAPAREALAATLLQSGAAVRTTASLPVATEARPDATHAVLIALELI